jgi:hypothetical protein
VCGRYVPRDLGVLCRQARVPGDLGPALFDIQGLQVDLIDGGRGDEEDLGVVCRDVRVGDDGGEVCAVPVLGDVLVEGGEGADCVVGAEEDDLGGV